VRKEYHALSHGVPPAREFTIDAPIGVDLSSGRWNKRVVIEGGLPSVTGFSVLEDFGSCSLISARPHTGRTHQIRIHLAHAGFPILCDKFYGRESGINDRSSGEAVLDRHALHSRKLTFTHPVSGAAMEVVAPQAADIERTMRALAEAHEQGKGFEEAFEPV
jgi:23S rRNA-/tRNA-specific pseudouridylate synthase